MKGELGRFGCACICGVNMVVLNVCVCGVSMVVLGVYVFVE